MKKVTTNMTLGQTLFVILTILVSSVLCFYIGAKFGNQILNLAENSNSLDKGFLPDDKLASEIQEVISKEEVEFTFFDVVQDRKDLPDIKFVAADSDDLLLKEKPKFVKEPEQKQPVKLAEKVEKSASSKAAQTKEPKKEVKAAVKKVEKSASPKAKQTKEPKKEIKKKEPQKTQLAAKAPAKKKEVAKKPVVKVAKVEPKKPETTTAAKEIEQEVAKTRYLLQIGSFSSLKKAEKAKKKWAKRGYSPSIVVAQIPGKGKWYRLRLGLYDDYNVIKSQQAKIKSKYRQTAMILPIQ